MSDLVVDTIAARHTTEPQGVAARGAPVDGWSPLNSAYVDERRELFALTPDRLLLALRDAPDLRSLPDTVVAGSAHAAVHATVEGFPMTAFFRRSDGVLSLARYIADESNDFGLAPWGPGKLKCGTRCGDRRKARRSRFHGSGTSFALAGRTSA